KSGGGGGRHGRAAGDAACAGGVAGSAPAREKGDEAGRVDRRRRGADRSDHRGGRHLRQDSGDGRGGGSGTATGREGRVAAGGSAPGLPERDTMTRLKSGILVLLLAAPFALYAAYQAQSAVPADLIGNDAPSEKGLPAKEQLTAEAAKTEKWSGEVRKVSAVV